MLELSAIWFDVCSSRLGAHQIQNPGHYHEPDQASSADAARRGHLLCSDEKGKLLKYNADLDSHGYSSE